MADQKKNLHTDGLVVDYFAIESHVLSTRSADAYSAIDKSRSIPVCLWMLRHPLALNSAAVERFLERMRVLAQLTPPVCEMTAYGVDAGGTAFAVFPALDGSSVTEGSLESAEAERRFISCLRFVDRLHAAGVVCGDLCGASFWVNRNGDVRFIGAMGTFDAEAVATAMLPPSGTIPFFAPEQRGGAGIETASDVFSLGVLGYFLLTHHYPYGEGTALLGGTFDLSSVRAVSSQVHGAPQWADQILPKCLNPSPDLRFRSAGEVLRAIMDIRQGTFAREKLPAKKQGEVPVRSGQEQVLGRKISIPSQEEIVEETLQAAPKILSRKILLVALITVAAVFLLMPRKFTGRTQVSAHRDSALQHAAALGSEELRSAVRAITGADGASLAQKAAELEKIVNSDDPLAHEIIVRSAREAASREMRELSEKAIIDRARRLGLMRSAEQLRQWLRTIKEGALPSSYEAVLKALDTTLPIEARSANLRQAYVDQPEMTLKLAIALALDTDRLEDYQGVLAQMIGDSMKLDEAGRYSAIALILAHPDLSAVFGEDVIQKRNQIPDSDLLWLLKILADRNDIHVRAVASLAVERGILPPLRAQFLQLIRDRADLPPDVMHSLLRAAGGALKLEDVASFGRWYDLETEKVLLAVCADAPDKNVQLEAFDTLAGRSLTIEPSASVVEWIRKNHWDKRGELTRAVGILANLEKVSQADIDQMFASLDRLVRDSDLMELLLGTNSPAVISNVLSRYSDLISLPGLLRLLDNADKQVRINAIRSLKGYNDIGALKVIIDHYEREQDQEVKQMYRDTFWMIRQRQG